MRIISGKGKGTKLYTKKGDSTRPTSDRAKEAIFSIISDDIINAKVLDLFAGSGALGLEAISRGASFAILCDNDKESIGIIKKNIDKVQGKDNDKVKVCHIDAIKFLEQNDEKFDLIFLDPPYGYEIDKYLELIQKKKILKDSGLIIYETERDVEKFKDFIIIDKRKYGRPYIVFLKNKRGNNGSI